MQIINYVDGLCAEGKTTQLIQHVIKLALNNNKVIIAQPTTRLIKATTREIKKQSPDIMIHAFFAKHSRDHVVRQIEDHIADNPLGGEIIMITHAALFHIQNSAKGAYHLFIDETPSVFTHIELKINVTHHYLTNHLRAVSVAAGVSMLKPLNLPQLKALDLNMDEDVNIATFKDVCAATLSPHSMILVNDHSYNALVAGTNKTPHTDFFRIVCPSFFQGYKEVCVLSAVFHTTQMAVMWRTLFGDEMRFEPHPELSRHFARIRHANGHRLSIRYFFDKNWSLTYSQKQVDEEFNVLDHVVGHINHYHSSENFLWLGNVRAAKNYVELGLLDSVYSLPPVAHGMNNPAFMECHNVALFAALNMKTAAYALLSKLGVLDTDAKAMLTYNSEYQAMMRCSLRNPMCEELVSAIVCDRGSAEWLAALFPGCTVEKMHHEITELVKDRDTKARAMTSTERSRKRRARLKERLVN